VRAQRRAKRSERRRRRELADILGYDGSARPPPAGVPKMSDVLVVFAEPILDTLDDDAPLEEYRAALRCASAIWNILTMLDEEHRRSVGALADDDRVTELMKLLDEAVGGFDEESLALIDELRNRRRGLFPHERRIVMRVEAELQGDRVHVVAASALL
jgi:hypothetical protein